MLKVVAALLLLFGSGLIFHALVAMDAPSFHPPRLLKRRPLRDARATPEPADASLRRAA
jgi:hypothetical protein